MLTYPADTLLSVSELADTARAIRRNALLMGEVQGQGYIAQALGIADVLAVAYFHALRYRPADPAWEERDRFFLSIGHYGIALYAALIPHIDYHRGGTTYAWGFKELFEPRQP